MLRNMARNHRRQERICSICSKTFTKQEHLERHVRSHTGEKPYKCTSCGKAYSRNDTLIRHERGHIDRQARPTELVNSPYLSRSTNGTGSGASPIQVLDTQTATSTLSSLSIPLISDETTGQALSDFLPDAWDTPHLSNGASWSLPMDTDIRAIDSALITTISDWAQLSYALPNQPQSTHQSHTAVPFSLDYNNDAFPNVGDSNESEELVCSKWYTRLKLDEGKTFPSRAESEGAEEQFRVNENYRDTLSRKLRPKYLEDAKLSVEYLNLCLRLYFNRFHPILPLIHVPTFRSNSQNALLFLSMCSIGSLFIGSADAAAQGHRIFSRLNKAILASWETHLSTNKREALSMVQAAVLGQTFGLLSGRPSDLVMVDAFHGTLFAWARKVGAFENQELRMPIVDMGSEELDKTWKEWIYAEQLARLAVVLYIHDAEMGNLFHHDSFARLTLIKYSTVVHDHLFQAPTARE